MDSSFFCDKALGLSADDPGRAEGRRRDLSRYRDERRMHLAQFLCHGPTYHSLAMWRHPRTAAAGYDWTRPELYQHIARVCERGKFDMVFFADLNYISDTYRRVDGRRRSATRPRRPSTTPSRCCR